MIMRLKRLRLLGLGAVVFALCACNLMGAVTPIPTLTPTHTQTPTLAPSATFTPTLTPTASRTSTRTQTPSVTPTPSRTPTATITLTPSQTPTMTRTPYPDVPPQPTVALAVDQFARVQISPEVQAGIGQVWLSFINTSPKEATATPGTPVAATNTETINLASPDGRLIYPVIELPASTGARVYWSPDGAYLAYFLEEGARGLYALDLKNGITIRLFAMDALNPRGIVSEPSWSPDGRQITLALTTAYDVDIFSVGPDGANFRNLTQHGAFDFWARWSPDGRYLAFVSDRDHCLTWQPNAPGSCYTPEISQPDGGNPYVLEVATGTIIKLADVWVIEPPSWVTSSQLSIIGGVSQNLSAGSTLYLVDVNRRALRAISNQQPNGTRIVRESWSADGTRVVYQELGAENALVMRDAEGVEIARNTAYAFPRFAFAAAWSPSGNRVILAGRSSQCPFGIIVMNSAFQGPSRAPAANPGGCDPIYSPDGSTLAFTGVRGSGAGTDGRFDVYLANAAGTGIRNLTGRLGGQASLLGWIGTP